MTKKEQDDGVGAGGGVDRRTLLESIGRLSVASLVLSVLPRVRAAEARGLPDPKLPGRTNDLVAAAQAAIAAGVDEWTAGAVLNGGVINGADVFLPPRGLTGPPFADQVEKRLLAAQVAPVVAAAIAGLAWEVWAAWSGSWFASRPREIASFAALPSPEAPPTPLDPFPLREGEAAGLVGLRDYFAPALRQLIEKGGLADVDAGAAIEELARWYRRAFDEYYQHARVQNLIGKGPVPTFAPPYVPVGPVINGRVAGLRVLVARPFA